MPSKLPLGLLFFKPTASGSYRRKRLGFAALVLIAFFALTAPVYMLFAKATPFVLGLPLSLAWIVAWMLTMFAALIALYRSDYRN
ncbi:MAG: hypothetical protein RhofKO_21040 [Rhodothermales bacterium]